ncbi:MAG: hypothetical protein RIR87_1597, partial [Actinomycetota bacterium]
ECVRWSCAVPLGRDDRGRLRAAPVRERSPLVNRRFRGLTRVDQAGSTVPPPTPPLPQFPLCSHERRFAFEITHSCRQLQCETVERGSVLTHQHHMGSRYDRGPRYVRQFAECHHPDCSRRRHKTANERCAVGIRELTPHEGPHRPRMHRGYGGGNEAPNRTGCSFGHYAARYRACSTAPPRSCAASRRARCANAAPINSRNRG